MSLADDLIALALRVTAIEQRLGSPTPTPAPTPPAPTPVPPTPTPAPTPAPVLVYLPGTDDADGTWRTGSNVAVRWGGILWRIVGGSITRAGRETADVSLTANVIALGIEGQVLEHRSADGKRWRYTGTAHWQLVTAAPPATTPSAPSPVAYKPGTPPAKVRQWLLEPSDRGVAVPRDFVGMHLHRYPNLPAYERRAGLKATPRPTYGYGSRRTWDYAEATAWCAIAGTSGTARDWAMLDEMIEAEVAAGHSVMMTINGTPRDLSSNPTGPGKFGGWPGCNYAPRDAAGFDALRRYVADLLARYGSRIAYWDGNNEPDPDNPIPAKDNFWIGPRSPEHAEWHRQIRLGVPRGRGLLIGPSQVFWDLKPGQVHDYALSVLTARDTQGTRLIDHLDGYGWHYYSDPGRDPFAYWQAITAIKATLAAAGAPADFPIFDTEHGKLDDRPADPAAFAVKIQRECAIAAAAGLRGIYLYSGDGPNLDNPSAGGPMGPAVNRVNADLPGLTLREGAILTDGRVWLRGLRDGAVVDLAY